SGTRDARAEPRALRGAGRRRREGDPDPRGLLRRRLRAGHAVHWRRMAEPRFVPYRPPRLPVDESRLRALEFYRVLDGRRSVRFFSSDPVPLDLVESLVRAASTAPSGAHKQPWTFVAISDLGTKAAIRQAAEVEEKKN